MDHISITNEDLGIRDDGTHNRNLTYIEATCIGTLESNGKGRNHAIPSGELITWVFPDLDIEQAKRNLRALVNHIICTHRLPICSMPGNGGGYWLPETKDEEVAVYEARRKRAFTGLVKMSLGRKGAYVDTIEQLSFWFDEPEGAQAIERLRLAPDKDEMPIWLKLVTRLLTRIEKDPQRYAVEISALQRNFGDIFVPRATMNLLKEKLRETQELLGKIA